MHFARRHDFFFIDPYKKKLMPCADTVGFLFTAEVTNSSADVVTIVDDPGAIAVQSAPAALGLCLWAVALSTGSATHVAHRQTLLSRGAVVASVCAAGVAVLLWRGAELLQCDDDDGVDVGDGTSLGVAIAIGASAVNALLIFGLAPAMPRIAALVALAFAAGAAAGDWALRGGLTTSVASVVLLPVQFLCGSLAPCFLVDGPLARRHLRGGGCVCQCGSERAVVGSSGSAAPPPSKAEQAKVVGGIRAYVAPHDIHVVEGKQPPSYSSAMW